MVLGFGSKSKRKGVQQEDRSVRLSPSLPELSAQGVAWPENLVDIASIRQLPPQPETPEPNSPAEGTVNSFFRSPSRTGTVPFHRPFRVSAETSASYGTIGSHVGGPIHALYTSHPPPSFSMNPPSSATSTVVTKRSLHRKTRVPPMFNLMVAGGKRTGKTSLLKLLVDTADISPSTTSDQKLSIDKFLAGDGSTRAIESLFIEICESSFDRVLLSVIDTPGLDFQEGHELKLDRQVTNIVKYIDLQYADTMDEESKVIRRSKGDQHVHLCIYLIDPASFRSAIIPPPRSTSLRRTVSQSTLTPLHRTRDATPDSDSSIDLMMNPADIRVIRRLSTRVNVLPVVARADTLTDEKLIAIKVAMRRDLGETGLGFGVFAPPVQNKGTGETSDEQKSTETNNHANGRVAFPEIPKTNGTDDPSPPSPSRSRNVIKLRNALQPQTRNRSSSRSRSRFSLADLRAADDDEPLPPDAADPDSIANVRFSARRQTLPLEELLPFALVMPERTTAKANSGNGTSTGRRPSKTAIEAPRMAESESDHSISTTGTAETTIESIDSMTTVNTLAPPTKSNQRPTTSDGIVSSSSTQTLKNSVEGSLYSQGQPRDLKGVFVRRFRWGTVDVLDPAHCDFAAMRTAILSTHLKVLKKNTKEVLYEQYRTEKLLARRATRNISEEDRKRLLDDLGI